MSSASDCVPVVGWYAHHLGAGHVSRAAIVARRMRSRVVVLSSAPRPVGWPAEDWVDLADDSAVTGHDPDAGGALHWAPLGHAGYRSRMGRLAGWVSDHRPTLMVVDVSVEVTLLCRLLGVPTATFLKPGARSDRPHQLAYECSTALLATWPQGADVVGGWHERWRAKTTWCGAFSRFDDLTRSAGPAAQDRSVTVLWGKGGTAVSDAQIAEAARAADRWAWTVCRDTDPGDVWERLRSARVVVAHAGQNAVSEVAAARRPAIVVAQPRPHDEQLATAAALDDSGIATGLAHWPPAGEWPALLESASRTDGSAWSRWSDGGGADRCAAALDALAQAEVQE